MKRILTVQDLSCVGKCSLTIALPVLSAMGVETSVMPTGVLSTHTAFAAPVVCDLTDKLGEIALHWEKQGITFDGIYSGYLATPEQADVVISLSEKFPGSLIVDPVMGDNGKLYSRIHEDFLEKMRLLCKRADVILPNITEACYLAGVPYQEKYDRSFVELLLKKLAAMGSKCVLITGISFAEERVGIMGLNAPDGNCFFYEREKLGGSYHGTGDAFASAFAGGLIVGKPWEKAATLAADFAAICVEETIKENRDKRFGILFERALPWLVEKT